MSPQAPDEVELLLEPKTKRATLIDQQALFEHEIPWTAFALDNILGEYERMKRLGVVFRSKPTPAGPATMAVFEDTCGNLIQLYQV